MIQIKEKSLIIELPCLGEQPLALLANLQSGLIDLISLITYAYDEVPPDDIKNGVYQVHRLLKEMLVCQDQGMIINEGLTKTQTNEFNKWGAKTSNY